MYVMVGALLGVGAAVRIWAFAIRGPLWTDEAGLALNIVGRGFDSIARPFIYQQYAPYFYVISDKLTTLALGASEHALRLPSLLAGLLLLPSMALLAYRVADARAALFALALLVPNGLAIHYSTELKPYEQDALDSTGLWLVALRTLRAGSDQLERRHALILLAVCGMLAPWFSLPSIFVLAAIGLALAVDAWQRKSSAKAWLALAAVGLPAAISFAVHYLMFLRANPADAADLQRYWAAMDAFAPFPPRSLGDVRWYFAKFFYLFNLFIAQDAVGLRYVAALVWVAGVAWLWQRNRPLYMLLVMTLVLLMAASAAHAYIVADRTVLFMAPLVIVPIAVALAALSQLRGLYSQLAAGALTVAICLAPALALARTLSEQPPASDMRKVVQHLKQNFRPGDQLYVETQVEWIYAFYAHRAEFDAPTSMADSPLSSYDPRRALRVLDTIKGAARAWALVPTVGPKGPSDARAVQSIQLAERVVTQRLNQFGRQIDSVDGGNVRLYLYELSASAANDAFRVE
jgi:4-amino-4-deoxy-L-arabinose transferase-like glycosyltransferase